MLSHSRLNVSRPQKTGDKKVDGKNIHDFIGVRAFILGMSKNILHPRFTPPEPSHDFWDRLCYCERLAMAWNVGGMAACKEVQSKWSR